MYQKYKHINLSPPLIEMFTELIEKDEATRLIFIYVGKQMALSMDPNSDTKFGATISSITNEVYLYRRVKRKVRGGAKFELVETTVERKHVERVVSSLLLTGLCYYEQVGKAKVIYPTENGLAVLKMLRGKEKRFN